MPTDERLPETLSPEFRLRTVKGIVVNPELNLDRTSELVAEEDQLEFAVPGAAKQ